MVGGRAAISDECSAMLLLPTCCSSQASWFNEKGQTCLAYLLIFWPGEIGLIRLDYCLAACDTVIPLVIVDRGELTKRKGALQISWQFVKRMLDFKAARNGDKRQYPDGKSRWRGEEVRFLAY